MGVWESGEDGISPIPCGSFWESGEDGISPIPCGSGMEKWEDMKFQSISRRETQVEIWGSLGRKRLNRVKNFCSPALGIDLRGAIVLDQGG
jgi:hypothetical protein